VIAVLWQLLQFAGGVYVSRVIAHASQMNGVFAVVLGLVALLYIASVMAMLGLETNVVLVKRLYPRALLTPFTDSVELTDADRRVYREYAQAQRHKGFERWLTPASRQVTEDPDRRGRPGLAWVVEEVRREARPEVPAATRGALQPVHPWRLRPRGLPDCLRRDDRLRPAASMGADPPSGAHLVRGLRLARRRGPDQRSSGDDPTRAGHQPGAAWWSPTET
jgi:hypothetical protein